MSIEIVTVPCRSDNYAFLIHAAGKTALVDAPETAPLVAALEGRGWTLDELWLTHHHDDHVSATADLRARFGCSVTGATADAHRLPPLDRSVNDGDTFTFAGEDVQVMDVSGHTVGHIAFYIPAASTAFTADSLMALGCGRVFEGTFDQMWASLSKLAVLPPDTTICSGHEYTAANAAFAVTIEPDNPALISRQSAVAAARQQGTPTVPSRLSEELETNPFLRASRPEVKAALGMSGATDAEVFAEIRRRKDAF
ncbi:MAG: hydroxyacylglutathione hydrolase [Pseudomonadota bacterium]